MLLVVVWLAVLGVTSFVSALQQEKGLPNSWLERAERQLQVPLKYEPPRGLKPVLQDLLAHGPVMDLRLMDQNQTLIAAWPPRITQQEWSIFAPLFSRLRAGYLKIVSRNHVLPLNAQYQLEVSYWHAGLWWSVAFWQGMLSILLMLAGLCVLWRGRSEKPIAAPVRAAVAPAVVPRAAIGHRLSPALRALHDGILLVDQGLKLRYGNPAALELLGLEENSLQGRPVLSALRLQSSDSKPITLPLDECLKQGRSIHVGPALLQPLKGGRRPVNLSLSPLFGRAEEVRGALIVLRDETGAQAVQRDLADEAELTSKVLDQLTEGIAITDKYGRILRVNRRTMRLFAYADGELEGVAISKLLPVPFLNEPDISLQHYVGRQQDKLPRVVAWRKDATTFPVDLVVEELEGPVGAYLLLIRDHGERQRQDNMSMRLGRLLDYAAEEIYIFDAHSLYITEANKEAREHLGYGEDQLGRMTPLHLAPDLDRAEFEKDLARLRSSERRQVVYRTEHRRADGSRYPVALRVSFSGEEEPPVFMALAQDISEQVAAESRLAYLAHNDALTGLPNRSALMAHLQDDLSHAEPVRVGFFLDLDEFKGLNDQYGHAAGDEVLIQIAQRLKACLPNNYYCARLAGDEFVVIGTQSSVEEAESLARELLSRLSRSMSLESGISITPQVSIGVVVDEGDEAAELELMLKRADQAMYEVKRAGGQAFRLSRL